MWQRPPPPDCNVEWLSAMPTCEIYSRQTPPPKYLKEDFGTFQHCERGAGETTRQEMCLFVYLRNFFRQQSPFEYQFQIWSRLRLLTLFSGAASADVTSYSQSQDVVITKVFLELKVVSCSFRHLVRRDRLLLRRTSCTWRPCLQWACR